MKPTTHAMLFGAFAGGLCALATTYGTVAVQDRYRPMLKTSPLTGVSAKAAQRQAARTWGELEQFQIDGLTKLLGKVDKRPVTILCRDRSECGDLALDLENAFESAKWDVKIDAPVIDSTLGVASNDPEIRAAVMAATGLDVKLVAKDPNHPVFVVIGRKAGA